MKNKKLLESPIRYYRKVLKITQQELAGENYTRGYIQSIETGKRIPSYKCALYIKNRIVEIGNTKNIHIEVNVEYLTKSREERFSEYFQERIQEIELNKRGEGLENSIELLDEVKDFEFPQLQIRLKKIIAEEFYNRELYMEAVDYYERILKMIREDGIQYEEVEILKKSGGCYFKAQDYDTCLKYYVRAEKILIKENPLDENLYSDILFQIGRTLGKMDKHKESMEKFQNILRLSGIPEDTEFKTWMEIAKIRVILKEYVKAEDIYVELYDYLCEKGDIQSNEYYLINANLGNLYYENNDMSRAKIHIQKCLDYKFKSEGINSVYSLVTYGKIMVRENNLPKAHKCFYYAIDIAEKYKDGDMLVYTLEGIFNIFKERGNVCAFDKYMNFAIKNTEIIKKGSHSIGKLQRLFLKRFIQGDVDVDMKDKIEETVVELEGCV